MAVQVDANEKEMKRLLKAPGKMAGTREERQPDTGGSSV